MSTCLCLSSSPWVKTVALESENPGLAFQFYLTLGQVILPLGSCFCISKLRA